MKVFAKVGVLCTPVLKCCCTSIQPPPSLSTLPSQMCDIGDASRGSLSSYAYTLMALFFLQQRNPPVIPVLQEVRVYLLVLQCEAR